MDGQETKTNGLARIGASTAVWWSQRWRWGSEPLLRALYAWSSIEDKKYKEDAAPGQDRAGKDEAPLWRARPDRDRGSRRRSTPLTIGLHC